MRNVSVEPCMALKLGQGPVRHSLELNLSSNAYVFKSSRYSPAQNTDSLPWVKKRPQLSLRQLDQHGAGAVNLAASSFALSGFVPLSSLSSSHIQVPKQHEAMELGPTPCAAFVSAPYAPSLDMISESPASCIAVAAIEILTDVTNSNKQRDLIQKPLTSLAMYRTDSTVAFVDSKHLLSLTEVFPGMGVPPCQWCSNQDATFARRPSNCATDYATGHDYPFLLPDPLIATPNVGVLAQDGDLAVLGSVIIYRGTD